MKLVLLYQLLAIHGKHKSSYKNYELKISAPTWNDKFELPDGSYSVSDIQEYFECMIKKHETLADNPPRKI